MLLVAPAALQAQEPGAPAVVQAEQEATLSSLISGVIREFHVDQGDAFAEGDVLVDLDCRLHQFEADAALARLAQARVELAATERLFSRGGTGRLEVDALRAELDAVAARSNAAALQVERCTVRAPFAGQVLERQANAFEYTEPGRPLISIVSSGTPDLEVIVPAEWLAWIEIGTRGRLSLDAGVGELPIAVTSISPAIDPVSRTLRITASIEADTARVLPGMSGLVALERAR